MNRRAFIAPFIVIVVLLFLSVLTLIVDGGKMVVAHSELQGISEVIVLSAASAIGKGESAVKANIERFIQLNHISNCTYTVHIESASISVTLTRIIPLMLSGKRGHRLYKVSATSRAASDRGQVRLVL